MKVKLKKAWKHRPKGTVINLRESFAQRLINWGTAEPYTEDKEEKAVKSAPKDKAVHKSDRK